MNFKLLSFSLLILVFIPGHAKEYKTLKEEIENPSQVLPQRNGKLFSVFQIVRFANDPCYSGSRNGTCYTAEECGTRGGDSSGSCANGYGVCCTFSKSCGAMTSENCTYFSAPSTINTAQDCTLEVCPCSNDICQLRLDFSTFTITGPSTDSTAVGKAIYGQPVFTNKKNNVDAKSYSINGQCRTDIFTVSSPGNTNPPPVCGDLTGEHMYVDLNDGCCDELRFQLGGQGIGAGISTRAWEIKVTQYKCDYNNLAPSGCTQYFFGEQTGQVMSFNFGKGQHLADQNQNICVRRERGNCRICWTATAATDFEVSGPADASKLPPVSQQGDYQCCSYGKTGLGTIGFDCVEIIGATSGGVEPLNPNSRFCGRSQGLGTASTTICSSHTPFSIRFRSDRFEFLSADPVTLSEGASPDAGFRLAYVMHGTDCVRVRADNPLP